MLSLTNIGVHFGSKTLFEGVSFQVNPRERIALAGRNGAGKTTLLNIIAGVQEPSLGTVGRMNDLTIGYLPQHMLTRDGRTVREEARQAFRKGEELILLSERLTTQLTERTDYDSDEYNDLVQKLSNVTELLAMYNPSGQEAEIEKTLKGLGFEQEDFERQTSEFSGGWRMRIELAKILLGRPDLLLLDEPTNHLDVESIVWLEDFIKNTPSGVVMVSHDRRFLDTTTTRTIELSLGKAYDYKVNYSKYEALRQERYEQQVRAYENQQKMIKDTVDFIERFRYKPTKAVQVQSRIKQLEKLERIEIDEIDRRSIHFTFPMTVPGGRYPITVEDLTVGYGERVVLDGIDLVLERGEKVALVGKNGSGKTTFVRSVIGEIPHRKGTITKGHNVSTAYFAQNQASLLDGEKTIHETIDDIAVGDIRLRINDILGAFMFGGEISEKKVSVLSGGEKSRLAMIRLLLSPSNLLILDEPTNHLDLSSKAVLKEAISKYEGTVLIVSHDRDFLDGLVDKVLEFRDGKIINHLGGMDDYLRKLREREGLTDNANTPTATIAHKDETPQPKGKEDYERRKELSKKKRELENRVRDLEAKIEAHENRLKEIEDKLATAVSPELLSEYEEKSYELRKLMEQWEAAQESLDEITG